MLSTVGVQIGKTKKKMVDDATLDESSEKRKKRELEKMSRMKQNLTVLRKEASFAIL